MSNAALLAYAAALLLAVMTPGPAMFAVISTGLARGGGPAVATGAGIALADVVLATLALLGLAALAESAGWIFAFVKYAGAAYLIWLGIRMWRAVPRLENYPAARSGRGRAFALGLSIGLGNPKAILFHASLMPLLLDLADLTLSAAAAILAIVLATNLLVMSGYGVAAGSAQRWFRTPRRLRWMNRLGGGAMIGTGAAIATR